MKLFPPLKVLIYSESEATVKREVTEEYCSRDLFFYFPIMIKYHLQQTSASYLELRKIYNFMKMSYKKLIF